MKSIFFLLQLAALVLPAPVLAEFLTCESIDDRRNFCPADTTGGALIIRQESKDPCEQGRSWDYDDHGVWVSKGCRAVFKVRAIRGEGGHEGGRGDEGREYRREPVAEQCPPGYSPSEQKCSPDERRRGCKDMRLPGGLGCVHR